MKKELLSIIVPCYNEEEVVSLFYSETAKVLKNNKIKHEFIFINDGSKDGTLSEIKKLSSNNSSVYYISFSRNFGKEAAIFAGLENAGGDYVVSMDADLQDPPYLLPEMIKILDEGLYDSVATRRSTRKGESIIRSFFAKMFYKIINKVSNLNIVDGARDYRMMNRKMVDSILNMPEYNRFSKGIFNWVGFNTYWISYDNVERAAGKTSWSFFGLMKYAIDGIINFSNFPLDIASFVGLIMTFIAFLALIFIIIRRLRQESL